MKNHLNNLIALERFGRKKLGVKELDDWYSVKTRDVWNKLKFVQSRGSLAKALKMLYPHHNWDLLRFSRVPSENWSDVNFQRDALERFGRDKLGVKELDDWYTVKAKDVHNKFKFIRRHYGSLSKALMTLYPHHKWDKFRFSKVPSGYWSDEYSQRAALEKFGQQLGVKELDDWYSITSESVKSKLSFIKNYYNGSLFKTLQALYPEHDWKSNRFTRVPSKTWADVSFQRDALERFGREHLGVKQLDDWYSVATRDVRHKLSFIGNYYNGSLPLALKTLYPHHHWDMDLFLRIYSSTASDLNSQRDVLDKFGREKLGVKELDDWYGVSSKKVLRDLGFIKKYYNGSLLDALKTLHPQHDWDSVHFTKAAESTWSDESAQRDALERFAKRNGVQELDDWYSVSATKAYNELGFIKKYSSLADALKHLYPQHEWDSLSFSRVPKNYWQQSNTMQHYRNLFVQWKQMHNIRTVDEWYQLPPEQVTLFKRAALRLFGGTLKMLGAWFPDIVWKSRFTGQLELRMQSLLKHVLADANINHYRAAECSKDDTSKHKEMLQQMYNVHKLLHK